jgi:hypothetical protein
MCDGKRDTSTTASSMWLPHSSLASCRTQSVAGCCASCGHRRIARESRCVKPASFLEASRSSCHHAMNSTSASRLLRRSNPCVLSFCMYANFACNHIHSTIQVQIAYGACMRVHVMYRTCSKGPAAEFSAMFDSSCQFSSPDTSCARSRNIRFTHT